jgi:hypothetical protein
VNNGERRLRAAMRRLVQRPGAEMPKPGSPWEAWVEYRLERLESQQTWLVRLILGALVTQVGLQLLGMLK